MTWETEIPGLPDEFIFQSLVKVANEHLESDAVTLYDHRTNSNTNCADLLADILGLQKAVLNILTPEARSALRAGQDVFILIVAPLGYEWIVGYLTVFSLGAVVACISDDLSGPEIARFIEDTKASAVLLASHARVTRQSLSDIATCPALNIQQSLPPRPLSRTEQFTVNPAHRPDPKSIGTVMFTSGSTSRPKGVLHSRETNNKRVSDVLDAKLITNRVSLMTSAPGSGATGSLYSLAYIVLGGIVHFPPAVWTPRWAWELIRTGTVSSLVDFPNVYQELIEFYWENLASLPPAEKDAYLSGLRSLVYAGVIGLINTYAATEVGHICLTTPTDEDFSNNCVGYLETGVDVKLGEGPLSELLVRTRYMFLGYLNRPDLTKQAFDDEGYYRTGDIVRREGGKYYIKGRLRVDVVQIDEHLVFVADIEAAVMSLPYVRQIHVVPLPTARSQQAVAAILRPREGTVSPSEITIDRLREDLRRTGLEEHQLPTVLRVTDPSIPLPIVGGGKPGKTKTLKQYFPEGYRVEYELEKA
ncbi:hypothetical protein HFD88_001947 [Aspergillus terreus]|nr:hypothetical protein HFD88_001947 [Aspergillus terreus]